MQKRTLVLTALGLAIALLAFASAWKMFPAGSPSDSASADEPDCVDTGLRLIDSGETELGEETLAKCLKHNPSLKLRLKTGAGSASDRFENMMRGWSPPFPDSNGDTGSDLSAAELAEKMAAAEDFLDSFPTGYHARLAVTLKALILYHRGKYQACMRWLNQNSDNTAMPDFSMYLSALAAWKGGQAITASGFANHTVKLYPDSPFAAEAAILTARIMLEAGENRSAAQKAREAAAMAAPPVTLGNALLLASEAYSASGDLHKHTRAILEIALSYPGIDIDGNLENFLDFDQDPLTMDDMLALARYFDEKERGYPIVKILSQLQKLPPEGMYLLARGYYLSGEYNKTEQLRDKLNDKGIHPEIRGRACLLSAHIQRRKQKWDKAIQQYGACAKNYESARSEAYDRSAWIHMVKKDERHQAQALEKLVAADPDHEKAPEYLLLVARDYLIGGNRRAAETFYEKINREYPGSYSAAEALFWLGKLAYSRSDNVTSVEIFNDLRNRFPYSYFYSRSADYLTALGQNPGNISTLLAQCKPRYPMEPSGDVLPAIGNALRHLNVHQPALDMFEFAAEKHPNRSAVGISRVLRDTGEITISIKTIENRAKIDPEFYRDILGSPELTGLLFPKLFLTTIRREAAKYNMHHAWPISIIRQESRFKPDARSSSNALGLMQIIPSTGKWIAKLTKNRYPGNSGMYNPDTNIKFGTWYFNHLLETEPINGNHALALAAYNGGPGNVRRWAEEFGMDDIDIFIEQMPRAETRGYVKKVMLNFYAYEELLSAE